MKLKREWQKRSCRGHVFEHVHRLEFCDGRNKLDWTFETLACLFVPLSLYPLGYSF